MALILLLVLLVILFGWTGFGLHVLWIVALVLVVLLFIAIARRV